MARGGGQTIKALAKLGGQHSCETKASTMSLIYLPAHLRAENKQNCHLSQAPRGREREREGDEGAGQIIFFVLCGKCFYFAFYIYFYIVDGLVVP